MSNNNLTRREFAKACTTTALAGTAFSSETLIHREAAANENTNEAKPSGSIDAHVHVWHPDTQKYPLSSRFTRADMQPPSFTAEELFANCKPAGVDRIVLIQMSFYEFDHTYMVEVMQNHPGVFSGVALIDYKRPDLVDEMKRLKSLGMRGLRLHSQGDAGHWPVNSRMATLWKSAPEIGLAVCPLINPQDIAHVDQLCQKYPETTVVVDHFARIGVSGTVESDRLEELCNLARFKRTHVKTSAFYALGEKTPPYKDLLPMIRQVCDAFGPDRLMWASDCPFQVQGKHDYQSSIDLIKSHAEFLSASDKESLLRKTAEKVFF